MSETSLFFGAPEAPLFGVFHEPARSPVLHGFVFCHPFGEEKLWSHRTFVAYARQLAAEGHPVLRFDYRGNGDSSGEFEQSSVTTALADVQVAVEQLRELTGSSRIALLGLRLGATIASLAADNLPDVEELVLWSPIVDGARYMQELLRINLSTQMAIYKEIRQDREALVAVMSAGHSVNVDGYEMTLPMYEEVSAIKLARSSPRYQGRTLIVHVDRQERPAPELQQLQRQYAHATLVFAQEEPFWKEIQRYYQGAPNLFARTDEWRSTGRRA